MTLLIVAFIIGAGIGVATMLLLVAVNTEPDYPKHDHPDFDDNRYPLDGDWPEKSDWGQKR